MIYKDMIELVSQTENISVNSVKAVLELLSEGSTIPFIARYRKEVTGGLDEDKIRDISKNYDYAVKLESRKEDVIRLIDEKGLLTKELENSVKMATKLTDVEDLYLPFKEKKETKATPAIKAGLEPLAKSILADSRQSLSELAKLYINDDFNSVEKVLEGASYIIQEKYSDDSLIRKSVRYGMSNYGSISSKIKKNVIDEGSVFKIYYEFNSSIKNIKPHNILAINRGEKQKILTVTIDYDIINSVDFLKGKVIKNRNPEYREFLEDALKGSLSRLVFPSVKREIRKELTMKAEESAINLFSVNLENLLLQPPIKAKSVLGVDPAYRTGCKLCALDGTGKVLGIDVIYPHQKNPNEKIPPSRIEESKKKIKNMIIENKIEIVAIGNGTASRETELFVAETIKEFKLNIPYLIVNEAGASVYSASKVAQEEFPDFSVEERSAASIGRRLQDPLSELVKIDPQSIGVGQYQHDVTQSKLKDSLDFTVSKAVNSVGVDLNTASNSILQYISGINKTIAKNIVEYRNANGAFNTRKELSKVPKLGPKAFEQAAGFLRINDGTNMLDSTSIHPESYKLAEGILKDYNIDVSELGKDSVHEKVDKLKISELVTKYNSDKYTIEDIIASFKQPKRDPRDKVAKPELRFDVLKLEDLKLGMELNGTVRNVVDFGAFVDIGLKNDGLVHISKMSSNFVSHPSKIVSVGDIIKVYVSEIDNQRNKVQLSMVK